MFRLGEDFVTCLEIFLINLKGINIPVLMEGDWSPVGYQRCWVVRGPGLEHPGTVENVETSGHGAPEIRIIIVKSLSSDDIRHNPTSPGACRLELRPRCSDKLRTGGWWRQQTW